MTRRRSYRTTLEVQTLSAGTTSADSRGHSQTTFGTIDTVQASVKSVSGPGSRGGDELFRGREIFAKATHLVELDYLSTIDTRSRFRFFGTTRVLNIVDANNVEERDRTLVCVCEEEKTT